MRGTGGGKVGVIVGVHEEEEERRETKTRVGAQLVGSPVHQADKQDAPRCQAVLDQAGVILRRHPTAAIVKITATALQFMTTDDGPDHAVLPAVLVYREGDLISKHIRFEGDLESLLRT